MKFFLISLFLVSVSFSQTKEPAHNIFYGEILGEVPGISINYERETITNLNIRFGFGIFIGSSSSNSGSHTMIGGLLIGMLDYLINCGGNNFIETDVGTATGGDYFFPVYGLGYRYSPRYGGFLFKAVFTILTYRNGHTFPFGGIGFGLTF
jgi:hypothetical protein